MRIVAYLPSYNEAENIGDLIDSWIDQVVGLERLGADLTVVGIDDHSTDDTLARMEAAAAARDGVRVIRHPENRGLVGGLNSAIADFLGTYGSDDVLVLMDGDNTHDPKYVFPLLERLNENVDCVIALRYSEESRTVGVSRWRVLVSDIARLYFKLVLRVPGVEDYTCGYRIYTHAALKRLVDRFGDEPLQEQTFACMMELLYKLHLTGTRFDEIGFELRYDRKHGKSKMSLLETTLSSAGAAIRLRREG